MTAEDPGLTTAFVRRLRSRNDEIAHTVARVAVCLLLITTSVAPAATRGVTENATVSDQRVEAAITESRTHLLTTDAYEDGHWVSPTEQFGPRGNVRNTIYYGLLLEHLDARPESKRAAIDYVLSERAPDGGFDDAAVNFGALLLLRSVDAERYTDEIGDIEREIERQNMSLVASHERTKPISGRVRIKLFYAVMSDRYETEELFPNRLDQQLPKLFAITPAFENGTEPNESMVVPFTLDSTLSAALLATTFQEGELSEETKRFQDAAERILLQRRLGNGVWKEPLANVFASLALYELGYRPSDPTLSRPLEWLDTKRQADSGRLIIYQLPVWDTAFAITALVESGVSPENETVRTAAQWLVDSRTTHPRLSPLDGYVKGPPVPFRKHAGDGWGYKPYMYSDWDDTALAITALSTQGQHVAADDARFLLDVQNSDGSWSAFATDFSPLTSAERQRVVDQSNNWTYQVLYNSHESPDVTGHALEALGAYGYSIENSAEVRKSVAYLKRARSPNGMWVGVWGEGFTYGTSTVLLGLESVGIDMDRPFVQGAVRELRSHQNPDGGWGEATAYHPVRQTNVSYRTAESTPAQTAWALQALLAAGVSPDHPAVQRAVAYLLETQNADGSWETYRTMYNLGPPAYTSSVTTQASVLRALSMYASARDIPLEETGDEGSTDPAELLRFSRIQMTVMVAFLLAVAFLATQTAGE